MENQAERQEVRIEGDDNRVTQDQRISIQINLSGAVVHEFVVQGGMHIYLQLGQQGMA